MVSSASQVSVIGRFQRLENISSSFVWLVTKSMEDPNRIGFDLGDSS